MKGVPVAYQRGGDGAYSGWNLPPPRGIGTTVVYGENKKQVNFQVAFYFYVLYRQCT